MNALYLQAESSPGNHPYNFRTFMERHFYGDICSILQFPVAAPLAWAFNHGKGQIGDSRSAY